MVSRPGGPIRVIVGTGPNIDWRFAFRAIETTTPHNAASSLHRLISLAATSASEDDLCRNVFLRHGAAPGGGIHLNIAQVVRLWSSLLTYAHASVL